MKKLHTFHAPIALAVMAVASIFLAGCTTVAYRCPLDGKGAGAGSTACAGLADAMAGARLGTGGKTSVLIEETGKLVPSDLLMGKTAVPLAAPSMVQAGTSGPAALPGVTPVYEQATVFQAWTPAFVDDSGNLHDGHYAWFTTPGRWTYGGSKNIANSPKVRGASGAAVQYGNTLSPSRPDDLPPGNILPGKDAVSGQYSGVVKTSAPGNIQPNTPLQSPVATSNARALQGLSTAAKSAGDLQATNRGLGVTAPAIGLAD
jgi:hypothetical protein